MYNPDYIPSGPANARNEYEMKVNHTRIARVDHTRSEYLGSRGGVPGFDFNTDLVFFYDPSDLSTMFQRDEGDSLAVTASDDPVGLMLDKSLGLERLSDVLPSAPTTINGWTDNGDGTFTVDNSVGSGNESLYYGGIVEADRIYEVSVEVVAISASGGVFKTISAPVHRTISDSQTGVITVIGRMGSANFNFTAEPGVSVTIRPISIKKIAGNHISQPDNAKRPLYQTDGTLHWLQGDASDGTGLFGSNPEIGTSDFFISTASRLEAASSASFPVIICAGTQAANEWMLRKVRDTELVNFQADAGGITSDIQGSVTGVDEVISVYRTAEGVRTVKDVDTLGPLDTTGAGADLTAAVPMGVMTTDDAAIREWNGRVYAIAGYIGTVDQERRETIDNFMMARAGLISAGDPEYDNLLTYGGSPLTYNWDPLTYGD